MEIKALTVKNFTYDVGVETKETPIGSTQKWTLEKENSKGWRRIIHSASGLYLSAPLKHDTLTIQDKGEWVNFGYL